MGEVGKTLRKAAFLDRDGVINVDHGYVHRWEDFQFVPGAVEGMRLLNDAGFTLVVVTNQSGIARGKYSQAEFLDLTRLMVDFLSTQGVDIAAVYHCPHHPSGTVERWSTVCSCRKPEPGLILRATADFDLDLSRSLMVGDKPIDMEAAKAAGVARAYQVGSDNEASQTPSGHADERFNDLLMCARAVTGGLSRL